MIAPRVRDRKSLDEVQERNFERAGGGVRGAVAGSMIALFGRSFHRGPMMQSPRGRRKPLWSSIAELETVAKQWDELQDTSKHVTFAGHSPLVPSLKAAPPPTASDREARDQLCQRERASAEPRDYRFDVRAGGAAECAKNKNSIASTNLIVNKAWGISVTPGSSS